MADLQHCVIATRESPLAMWQALHIQDRLRKHYPKAQVDILGMTAAIRSLTRPSPRWAARAFL